MRRNPSHSDLWISFSVYNAYIKDRQQRKLEWIEEVLIFAMAFWVGNIFHILTTLTFKFKERTTLVEGPLYIELI